MIVKFGSPKRTLFYRMYLNIPLRNKCFNINFFNIHVYGTHESPFPRPNVLFGGLSPFLSLVGPSHEGLIPEKDL